MVFHRELSKLLLAPIETFIPPPPSIRPALPPVVVPEAAKRQKKLWISDPPADHPTMLIHNLSCEKTSIDATLNSPESPLVNKRLDFFEALDATEPGESPNTSDDDDEGKHDDDGYSSASSLSINKHRKARIQNQVTNINEFITAGMKKCYTIPLSSMDHGAVSKLRTDYKSKIIFKLKQDGMIFDFQDYAPSVFHNIRKQYGINQEAWVESLCVQKIEGGSTGAGKSGMLFFFSKDHRFILKTVSRPELKFFRQILKKYHRHIITNRHTLLSRFYALHKIMLPNQDPIRFVIMNNVFETKLSISQRFDLKGSIRNREVHEDELLEMGSNPVLKDLNFEKNLNHIYVGVDQKSAIIRQLLKDSEFLQRANIMDFSLLLGVHESKASVNGCVFVTASLLDSSLKTVGGHIVSAFQLFQGGVCSVRDGRPSQMVYFMGIIDILQEFNLKKKLEYRYKSARYNKKHISAIQSKMYAQRFRKYIGDHLK